MKCPHCLQNFHAVASEYNVGKDVDASWAVARFACPACRKCVLWLLQGDPRADILSFHESANRTMIHPRSTSRPVPPEVPKDIAEDFNEAALVLADSPKSSAALSRRCLQLLLKEAAGATQRDLSKQIDDVLAKGHLPSHISELLDSVRVVGNFAAHATKSQTTGEIVQVEPGEAETNLDVLESLFDFYYVQPAIIKRKRDALNKKLADAGKPPVK